jgi:outer membrane murein-binding lipoprotein Lpp
MRNVVRLISASFLTWCLFAGCTSHSQKPQYASWSEKATTADAELRNDAVAACINAIYTRLVSLRGDFPQLSAIDQATVTLTNLHYAKGTLAYDRNKTEHWGSPDACRIYVNFEKYSSADLHQQGAVRQFPESGIQVHWLILPIRTDSMEFLKAVDSIIRDETEKLAETLE